MNIYKNSLKEKMCFRQSEPKLDTAVHFAFASSSFNLCHMPWVKKSPKYSFKIS